jgi:hypothetical protein
MAKSQTQQPQTPSIVPNEHNQKEHEEKLRREASQTEEAGAGMNEHNRKEHEEKLQRESQKRV